MTIKPSVFELADKAATQAVHSRHYRASLACQPFSRLLWVVALGLVALTCGAAPQPGADFLLGPHAHQIMLNSNGALVAWAGELSRDEVAATAVAGEIRYRDKTLKLESPQVARTGDRVNFTYRWPAEPGLEVTIRHLARKEHGAVLWAREFKIQSEAKLVADLTVSLQSWPRSLPADAWLPLLNGTGAALGTNAAAAYRFAGALPGDGALLALPLVSLPIPQSAVRNPHSTAGRILIAADPYFSTLFRPAALEWTYLAKGGFDTGERTLVVAAHNGSVEDSLAWFFRAVLPDVAPGPAWLHDIAMVDFDYLSDEGRGWFADIDALTAALPKVDRRQVFLCLHGWYDFLGRYCFDARTRKLDREWTAFSSYEIARTKPLFGTVDGEQVEMGFTNCKPAKMSLAEVHRRLQYARSRGFRAGLYFADGMNAGDGLPDFDPARVLQWGGWQGADSKGKSYFMNPLHPQVRAFFLDYTKALLAEFGPDTDALVWDETFHIPCGKLGTDAWPGYADRAMMRLVQDITALVEDYNRRHGRKIAFLTSDCLGAFGDSLIGPYALVSHGTYQDSWCQPKAWSYGIFANYRNALWSCCWWPVTKWPWVEFGVREYQAPVAISNGWGNDKGFSELTPAQQARVLELFKWRKQHRTKLKWFERLPSFAAAAHPAPKPDHP